MSEDQVIAGFAAYMREHGLTPPRGLAADACALRSCLHDEFS